MTAGGKMSDKSHDLIAVASDLATAARQALAISLSAFFFGLLCGCDPPEPIAVSPDSGKSSHVRELETFEAKPQEPPQKQAPASIASASSEPYPPYVPLERSAAVIEFLRRFDPISDQGYVPTLRRGSTGVGYTLETMLAIEENNSPGGDLMGMEIKAFRDADIGLDDAEKMNLFLKEPKWIDGLKASRRVTKYGYVDDNGRTALYSTVTIEQNSHGFSFAVEDDRSRVWLNYEGQHVAYWTREILEKRLSEKHAETVFVSARSLGSGKTEQFHYYGVTWCRDASVEAFIDMLQQGDVMLELRMHLKETGSTRNHGSAFRIKQNRIRDLFKISVQVRPK